MLNSYKVKRNKTSKQKYNNLVCYVIETIHWWQNAVIYQIYPRSFCDSNQDGVGDLQGILNKLDYLVFLGIDAVWISPFFKSPMKDFGYDIMDYQAIDPLFGTLQDFDILLEAAHQKNIRIIIDLVPCHTSDQHPWFSLKPDWYIWADAKPDGSPPNNWRSFFGGPAWEWNSRHGKYYLHHFLKEQPNLNYRNPEVAEALMRTIQFWFERGVDGLRLDAIVTLFCDEKLQDNPPRPLDHPIRKSIRAKANPFHLQEHRYSINQHEAVLSTLEKIRNLSNHYKHRYLIGEIGGQASPLDDIAISALYVTGEQYLHSTYNFELLSAPCDAEVLKTILTKIFQHLKPGKITFALSNHDVMRVATRWDGQAPLALSFLLSLPGSICLYQGEELGLPQATIPFEAMRDPEGIQGYPAHLGRDGCRTPMPWSTKLPYAGFSTVQPWLPIPDTHLERAVDVQMQNPDSLLHFTRSLIAWRKQELASTIGETLIVDLPLPLLGIMHKTPEKMILCVFNFSSENRVCTLPEGDWQAIESLRLGPYESYIAGF